MPKMTIDLLKKLDEIADRADASDAIYIHKAKVCIEELEVELAGYKDDITDWRLAVEKQMARKTDSKRHKPWVR